MNDKSRPLAYNVNGFCDAIGIGRTKVYQLIGEGKLKAVKIGGRTLIPFVEAEKLINGDV